MGAKDTQRARFVESLMASNGSVTAAAGQLGISRKTAYRWLADSETISLLRDAEGKALDHLQRSLLATGDRAVATLAGIMDDAANPPGARITAARTILENILRLRELANLESRLQELEARVEQNNNPPR